MSNNLEEMVPDKQDSFRVDVFDAESASKLVKDRQDIRVSGGLFGEAIYVNGRDNGHITIDAGPADAPKVIVMPGAEANISVVGNSKAEILYKDAARGNVMLEGTSDTVISSDSATIGLFVLGNAVTKLTAAAESSLYIQDRASGRMELDIAGSTTVRFAGNPEGESAIKINAKDDTKIELEGDLKSRFDISRSRNTLLTTLEAESHKDMLGSANMMPDRAHKALAEEFRSGDLEKLKDKPELKSAVEAYETSAKYIDAHFGTNVTAAAIAKTDIRDKIAGVIEAGKSIAVKAEAIPKQVSIKDATETRAVESPKLTV